MKKLFLVLIVLVLAGCMGSPVHMSITYGNLQKKIKKNNTSLLSLKIGMTKDEVMNELGNPEQSEGYSWGSSWLYRTAMTSGVYGTQNNDFTPIVFDQNEKIVGWGKAFFTEHVKKYEITVKGSLGSPL